MYETKRLFRHLHTGENISQQARQLGWKLKVSEREPSKIKQEMIMMMAAFTMPAAVRAVDCWELIP